MLRRSNNATRIGVVLVALLFLFPGTGGAETLGRYVALGDSYSSGTGSGLYEANGDDSHPCKRSALAYPQLVANALQAPFEFWACSGAHIAHLYSDTVERDEPPFTDPARVASSEGQLSYLDRLGSDVSLVTITIGGHDAGFGDVMFKCVQPFFFGSCTRGEKKAQRQLRQLADDLPELYAQIRSGLSPDARVLVLGYPQLFPDNPDGFCLDGGFINKRERRWLNEKADQLNDVIQVAASQVAGIEFVDVREAFRGHEICGDEEAFLTGASPRNPGDSFHPNYKGHAAMAELVVAHLQS